MSARAESAKMLASLMGIDPDDAAERLDRKVLITASGHRSASGLAAEVVSLLERTLASRTNLKRPISNWSLGMPAPGARRRSCTRPPMQPESLSDPLRSSAERPRLTRWWSSSMT